MENQTDPTQADIARSQSYKFLVFGDSQCGKTSLFDYFCKESNQKQRISQTIGCDVHIKAMNKPDEGKKELDYYEFWDFAGDSTSSEIYRAYLRGLEKDIENVKGLIYVFDASNIKTLFHIQKHLEGLASEILMLKGLLSNKDSEITQLPLIIIGNKSDLLDEDIKRDKKQITSDYIKCIFNDAKIHCLFLSNSCPNERFNELDQFLQKCVSGDNTDLIFYHLGQKLYCYEGITAYAKRQFNSLTRKIMRVQNYFSLHLFKLCTFGLAIAFTQKN